MIEDGFNPDHPIRVQHYAAQLGELSAKKPRRRSQRGENFRDGLTKDELAWVDAQRALVPSFDDLAKGRA